MKTTAYLRISTADQDIEKNKSDILKLANEKRLGYVEFIEEQISGKVSWRKRKLFAIIDDAKKDDVLIVSELSRLGRSMLEIMEILSIASQKQMKIYAVKGNWNLDDSIQSKVMAMAFSIASEIERDLISIRTKEALRFKKENGIKLGRPKGSGKSKLDKFKPEIEALLANGSTQKFIANRYDTTEANLYNWLKEIISNKTGSQMKYTLKVELEVEIEFLNIDELDEDAKEEIEDIVVETLSDNSYEITKNIFDEMKQHTHVKINKGFAYEDERSTNTWDDDEE